MSAPPPTTPGPHAASRSWILALAVVTAAAAVRLVFAALIPAFPDETYYWDWSRRLAAGYFDHPPAIAWLVRAGDVLLAPFGASPTTLSMRLGPVLAGWIAAVGVTLVAGRLAGGRAALRAAVVVSVIPLAAAGLILATPDAPLLAATALALYCLVRALEHPPRSRASLGWWAITGVALGAAFGAKYTSIFLPFAVVAAVIIHPALRPRLAEPGPYLACAIATLVFAPALAWNASHGWISFVHQIRHGLSAPAGSALVAAWKHEGDLFGGQAGLASPVLFVMLAMAVGRSLTIRARPERFVLAMVALFSFGFFVYSAVRQRPEPNWPSPAYIPAIILLAASDWGDAGRKWLRGGVALAAAMSGAIYAQGVAPVLPIPASRDPIARAFGWNDLAAQAASQAAAATDSTGRTTWLGGDRYQEASELAFHAPAHPRTFATNLAGRPNQYDLWPGFSDTARPGDNLVLAVDDGTGMHAAVSALAPYFTSVRAGPVVALRRAGNPVATRRLWVLLGWDGRPIPTTGAAP